jgi:hypothetical protein
MRAFYSVNVKVRIIKITDQILDSYLIQATFDSSISVSFAVKLRAFDNALTFFEKAEEFSMKCGNKANVTLLREAEQCIKIWLEKKENQGTGNKRNSDDQENHTNSDDDENDP